MKKEMLTLVIGILIGAIIATGIFLVLQNNSSSNNNTEMTQMDRGSFDENSVMGGERPGDMGNTTDGTTDSSASES